VQGHLRAFHYCRSASTSALLGAHHRQSWATQPNFRELAIAMDAASDPQPVEPTLRLLVWNVNGLPVTVANAKLRYQSWRGFFNEHRLDIACFQETKLTKEKLTKELCCVEGYQARPATVAPPPLCLRCSLRCASRSLRSPPGAQSFWACSQAQGKLGASGVVTYAAAAWAPLSAEVDALGAQPAAAAAAADAGLSGEGRVMVTDHGAFVLVNVYVPNAGDAPKGRPDAKPRLAYKLRFLDALRRRCDALAAAGREVLLVGDFNVAADPRDAHPRIPLEEAYTSEERGWLAAAAARYVDVWRRLHPDATGVYTVWNEKTSARAFNEGVRMDFALATPGLAARVASCEVVGADVLPPKWSDHAALLVELRGVAPPQGAPARPCAQWAELNRRFNDPAQRSIAAMFGAKKAGGGKRAAAGGGEARAEGEGEGEGEAGADAKRQRVEAAAPAGNGGGAAAQQERRQAGGGTAGGHAKGKKNIASFFAPKGGG
jgi:exodeoxyribonuclease III